MAYQRPCRDCGKDVEIREKENGKYGCYEVGSSTYHRCKEYKSLTDQEKKAHKDRQDERHRISMVKWYEDHEMRLPVQYQSLRNYQEYEEWVKDKPGVPMPEEAKEALKKLGILPENFVSTPVKDIPDEDEIPF